MKTPEQIADDAMTAFTIRYDEDVEECSAEFIHEQVVAAIEADRAQRIEAGAIVVHIHRPEFDSRRVIAVGDGWVWLEFQQSEIDAGGFPARLPIENYRRIA